MSIQTQKAVSPITSFTPFKKVLIANRGEIALRIIRACRTLGIRSVLVHSQADENSLPCQLADETICIGQSSSKDSYLNSKAILAAAWQSEADAIHPGYGFLAENADFAQQVTDAGFVFVGPTAQNIKDMGDKVRAKELMIEAGVPCVPGSDGALPDCDESIQQIADKVGYPVIIKAAGGGGGRGMRVVMTADELLASVRMTKQEAGNAFGNPTVYLERYLQTPRHIEIQVIADKHGNAIHLGERDCSMQRRHQKVIEESPAPQIAETARRNIGEACVNACIQMGYEGVGTFEFLYEKGEFFFIEMNTRIQVEHPVTELVTRIDLVVEQLKVAQGLPLPYVQDDVHLTGHAFECRINAEDPKTFMPSAGILTHCHLPAGCGVRTDSHLYAGYNIPPFYDSLLAKVCVHAATRQEAIHKMQAALSELSILGVKTNQALHQAIFADKGFCQGAMSIHYLEDWLASPQADNIDVEPIKENNETAK